MINRPNNPYLKINPCLSSLNTIPCHVKRQWMAVPSYNSAGLAHQPNLQPLTPYWTERSGGRVDSACAEKLIDNWSDWIESMYSVGDTKSPTPHPLLDQTKW